jgi:serine/threonine-protein kinase
LENVLVSFDGAVKLTDFGIAYARDKFSKTRPGVIKGKLAYMAPEQARGGALDGRVDVFGLCLLLWEMLTRQPFFIHERPVELLQEITACAWRPGVLKAAGVDSELERIIERGLKGERDERWPSANALEQALRRYLAASGAAPTRKELAAFVRKYAAGKREANQRAINAMMANPSARAGQEETRADSAPTPEPEARRQKRASRSEEAGPIRLELQPAMRNPMVAPQAPFTARPAPSPRHRSTAARMGRPHRNYVTSSQASGGRLKAFFVLAAILLAMQFSSRFGGPDLKLPTLMRRASVLWDEVSTAARKASSTESLPRAHPNSHP